MMTMQLTLHEQTVADTIAAASAQGLSFNDYVEWRLNADLDASLEQIRVPTPDQSIDELARELFLFALEEPAEDTSDEETIVEARPFLVEDLYKRRGIGIVWEQRDRGNRIMLGKAFKRVIDAQAPGGREIDDGRLMKVVVHSRTAQNQTKYKTVYVGCVG
jgi:hypothetical protein